MKKVILLMVAVLGGIVQQSEAQIILQDNFTYSDGKLTNVSANAWAYHSGGVSDDLFVRGGRAEVFASRAADVNRAFSSAAASTVYASFTVNMTNLPTAAGGYFAHFKDNGTSNFRARVYALGGTNLVAGSTWRLGIAAAAGSANKVFPLDLATNVDYRVVVAYDNANFTGQLWVDPVETADANQVTSDTTTALTVTTYALRQATGIGSIQVDDLIVGNSFADVNVGAVKPAIVYTQPIPAATVFTGGNTNLYCTAGGAGTVTFQWQHAGTNLVDDANHIGTASNRLSIVSALAPEQSGIYQCIVTSTTNGIFSTSVTSSSTSLLVTNPPIPPTIVTQPTNTTVFFGQTAVLAVGASGPGTITYQWNRFGTNLPGEVNPTLTILNVQTNNDTTGTYTCGVTNEYGGVLSSNAVLSAIPIPLTDIGVLRTMVDNTFFLPTNTTSLFKSTGIVTTYTNITTSGNCSFYMQDGTGGINVFIANSTARPAAGDSVTVVGPLGTFNGLLEFNMTTADPAHTIVTNSSGNALPAPIALPFNFTNTPSASNAIRFYQGALVTITNAYFPVGFTGTNDFGSGVNVTVTNSAGEGLAVRVDSRVFDIIGKRVPPYGWTITGPMGFFISSNTDADRAKGFQLTPTRFSDIVYQKPASVSYSGPNPVLTWEAGPNVPYSVLRATDVDGTYSEIATGLSFGTTSGTYTDTTAPSGNAFYKIRSP